MEKHQVWKSEWWRTGKAKILHDTEKNPKEKRPHLQSSNPDKLGQQESVEEMQERR